MQAIFKIIPANKKTIPIEEEEHIIRLIEKDLIWEFKIDQKLYDYIETLHKDNQKISRALKKCRLERDPQAIKMNIVKDRAEVIKIELERLEVMILALDEMKNK